MTSGGLLKPTQEDSGGLWARKPWTQSPREGWPKAGGQPGEVDPPGGVKGALRDLHLSKYICNVKSFKHMTKALIQKSPRKTSSVLGEGRGRHPDWAQWALKYSHFTIVQDFITIVTAFNCFLSLQVPWDLGANSAFASACSGKLSQFLVTSL